MLLKEGYKGLEEENEDVSIYWKREDTELERGSTRSHAMENSLWKGLLTCCKTDYVMMLHGLWYLMKKQWALVTYCMRH